MASGATIASGTKIPKLIHQIWIGPNPKPDEWMKTVEEFARNNGYEYRLWTEDNIDSLQWTPFFKLRTLYDAYTSYAGRSDILRYLILLEHGGLYIDADMVIVKPKQFSAFLTANKAPIFFGYEKPKSVYKNVDKKNLPDPDDDLFHIDALDGNKMIANSVIGAVPDHPFLQLACSKLVEYAEVEQKSHHYIKSGSMYLTRLYNLNKEKFPDIKFYPSRNFYPIHWEGITDPRAHHKLQLPPESMLFQYGYTSNNFAGIFKEMKAKAALGERALHASLAAFRALGDERVLEQPVQLLTKKGGRRSTRRQKKKTRRSK